MMSCSSQTSTIWYGKGMQRLSTKTPETKHGHAKLSDLLKNFQLAVVAWCYMYLQLTVYMFQSNLNSITSAKKNIARFQTKPQHMWGVLTCWEAHGNIWFCLKLSWFAMAAPQGLAKSSLVQAHLALLVHSTPSLDMATKKVPNMNESWSIYRSNVSVDPVNGVWRQSKINNWWLQFVYQQSSVFLLLWCRRHSCFPSCQFVSTLTTPNQKPPNLTGAPVSIEASRVWFVDGTMSPLWRWWKSSPGDSCTVAAVPCRRWCRSYGSYCRCCQQDCFMRALFEKNKVLCDSFLALKRIPLWTWTWV